MPDDLSRPPRASRRWRWVRWVLWVLVLAGLAGAGLASWWFFNVLKKQTTQPNSEAFLAVAGFVAAAAQVVLAGLQLRQGSHSVSAAPLAPRERREQGARDQLRQHLGRQDRLRRMGETSALALRVHPAIDPPPPPGPTTALRADTGNRPGRPRRRFLPRLRRGRPGDVQTLDQDLPIFVDRDKGPEVTRWMRGAREHGGFLMLVGDSSVGKTRLLYETAYDVLPDFAVLAPDLGDGGLVNSIAEATFPLPKLIVWLDELQRFLDGPAAAPGSTPITATAVRHLLDAPTPVVVLGAMWPEHVRNLRDTEPDPRTSRQRPRYPAAVDILGDSRVHLKTLTSFSGTEREAAAKLASKDPRLATALADRDYNVTEMLAGAPQLIARYEQASEEQKAVLKAAIDARRLGIQAPLTEKLLCAAARGYLSTLHPDDTWLDPALAELTRHDRLQDHATAPLIGVPNEQKREPLGYTVADYLLQHASRKRRDKRVPASTWDAFISHVRDRADAARLADSARNRLLYRYAIPLYRHAADAGQLAELLAQRGDLDELRARADAGDLFAARKLAERGDLDGLRALADAGDTFAARWLAELLAQRGDVDELRARAKTDDRDAAWQLADLLAQRGDLDGAVQVLHARADAGDRAAAVRLVELLAQRGNPNAAAQVLRDHAADAAAAVAEMRQLLDTLGDPFSERDQADARDRDAARKLADLLAQRGDLDGAVQVLRAPAEAGDWQTARKLADLLARRDDIDGLRARADAGDTFAARELAGLLAKRGDIDGLRARADAGDEAAAKWLAYLLAERGDLDGLRARTNAGDGIAAGRLVDLLADLLTKQGRGEEAERLRRFGLNPDGSIACG